MAEKIEKFIEQFKNTTRYVDISDPRLKKLDIDFVRSLSHLIEKYPGIKHGESKYITEKALLIAGGLDMSAEEKTDILYAGLLTQLGKTNLPYKLLSKPFYSMSTVDKYRYLGHAIDGDALLAGLPQFDGARTIIRHQYEHYDGQGFPDGLIEQDIPLGSRILSVVSDYAGFLDGSMTGTEMFADAALSQLMIRKNSCYDPGIVYIFSHVLKGASAEELKEAIVKEKKIALATEKWRKGVLLRSKNKVTNQSAIVEIALPQLRLGMKVESIFFGCVPYVRHCIVDQSILDDVIALAKTGGTNPIIKIILG